jgi:DNA-binding cell septation regulator SpoVG
MGARVSSGRAKLAAAAPRRKSRRANLQVMIHPPQRDCRLSIDDCRLIIAD